MSADLQEKRKQKKFHVGVRVCFYPMNLLVLLQGDPQNPDFPEAKACAPQLHSEGFSR